MAKKKYINPAVAAWARELDIREVAEFLGLGVKREGRTYMTELHDSLKLFMKYNPRTKHNQWFFKWFSRGSSGDTVELVRKMTGKDFQDAVQHLYENRAYFSKIKNQPVIMNMPRKTFSYKLRDSQTYNNVMNYLVNERGLNPNTVKFFVSQGVLTEAVRKRKVPETGVWTEQPVAVFKRFDNEGNLVGAELEGLQQNGKKASAKHGGRLKEIIKNSNEDYGVMITFGEPKRIVALESPIDMMSYAEIQATRGNLRDVCLINMAGLKEKKIETALNDLRGESFARIEEEYQSITEAFSEKEAQIAQAFKMYTGQDEITLATDNDEAGIAIYNRLRERYPHLQVDLDVPPKLPGQKKMDWNDYLKQLKANQIPLTQELPGTIKSEVAEQRRNEILAVVKANGIDSSERVQKDGVSPLYRKQAVMPLEQRKQMGKALSHKVVKALTSDYVNKPEKLRNTLDYLAKNPDESLENAILIKEDFPETSRAVPKSEWKKVKNNVAFKNEDQTYAYKISPLVVVPILNNQGQATGRYKELKDLSSAEMSAVARKELKIMTRFKGRVYPVVPIESTNIDSQTQKKIFEDKTIDFSDEGYVQAVRRGMMNFVRGSHAGFQVIEDESLEIPGKYDHVTKTIRLNPQKSPEELIKTEMSLLVKASVSERVKRTQARFSEKLPEKSNADEAIANFVLNKRYNLPHEQLTDEQWSEHLRSYDASPVDIHDHVKVMQETVQNLSNEIDRSVKALEIERVKAQTIAPQQENKAEMSI